jgi:hypothetical protein
MPLKTFADVQQLISQVLTQNGEIGGVSAAPHGSFWTNLSYQEFTTGDVPGVSPATPILVVSDSKNSNIIQALQGVGPLFGPNGAIGQMPGNGPPFFTDDQIKEIADWIDLGCPQ